MLPVSYRTLSSQPPMTSRPCSRPAAQASARPRVVSWSVRAMALRPILLASATSSEGLRVPSEAVECVCRSISGMTLGTAGSPFWQGAAFHP